MRVVVEEDVTKKRKFFMLRCGLDLGVKPPRRKEGPGAPGGRAGERRRRQSMSVVHHSSSGWSGCHFRGRPDVVDVEILRC